MCRSPLLGDPDRDDGRERDHPAVAPDLVEGRVEPHVRVGLFDRTLEERLDLGVELGADPRDLAPGDAVHPERPDQIVHLAGGDALHVGLLDHRHERALGPPARLEQTGK
jgi:hypothetical protein